MLILGIETSCDETSVSIVRNGRIVIANTIATSSEIHAKTGGIIPENAARQQIKSIIPVLNNTLKDADIRSPQKEIDLIAVTHGPGLIGSLLVGVEAAKTLSVVWKKPIVPVNHLVAHIYANWIGQNNPPEFPLVALVVSGGHTDMVYIKDHGILEWVGGTRDDAAGEAFDKTARLLNLPYPGGPQISLRAQNYIDSNPGVELQLFPRPLIKSENFDFSFSGLKTAVLKETNNKKITPSYVDKIAAEVQEAIVDVLVAKAIKAVNVYNPKSFLVAGGVSANKRLREALDNAFSKHETKLFIPEIKYCTDNATYICTYAYYNNYPKNIENISAIPNLSITGED